MRIKVGRGGDPGGLCHYLLQPKKREAGKEGETGILATNMVGRDAEELAEEFRFTADLNPRVQQIVTHYSISFPPGENPDLKTKQAIAVDLLDAQGHGRNCLYFAIEHFERQHKQQVHHFHVAAASVRLDGSWVNGKYERIRLRDSERAIETKHGLTACPPRAPGMRRNLTTGEAQLEERTGKPCLKRQFWDAIDQAAADTPTMPQLLMRLKLAGYAIRFREFEEEKKGLSFGFGDRYFQGRQLGDRYSFKGLIDYAGVSYQPDRDDAMLRQIEAMTAQQCQTIIEQQAAELRRQQQRDHYRQLYHQYAPSGRMEPRQRDRAVAKRALADRQKAKTAVLIVGLGREEAQTVDQQEHDAAIEYGAKMVEAAIKEQSRGIDR